MLQIQENILLAPHTTLHIGGPARFFVVVTTPAELLEALDFARSRSLSIFILGGGSNLLVTDAGFQGLVIHALFRSLPAVNHPGPAKNSHLLTASVVAGTDWDDFVLSICQLGITGVECLAGIPGLVGASPIQNIGAYGQDVAQTIHTVTALDLKTLDFVALDRPACGFAYRASIFNTTHRNRYIILGVTFRFDPIARPTLTYPDLQRHFADNPNPTPLDVYHAVRRIRQAKGMLLPPADAEASSVPEDPNTRSAGSFFKNPVVPSATLTRIAQLLSLDEAAIPHWPAGPEMIKLPAAWLLERAGFNKGFTLGHAGISSKHTLALINQTGAATFADITTLRDTIRREVEHRVGIVLEQEPVQLGN